jgi:hypothetical protein
MKLKLFILAIFSIMGTEAISQRLNIGFKGGANIGKIDGKPFSDEFSYGYHVGGFIAVRVAKKFSIQPEIFFNQTNIDTSSSFSSVYKFNNIDQIHLKYLTIPVLLNYKPVKHFALQAGPQFGILMNKNEALLENGKQAFKSGNVSMLAGIQLTIMHLNIYGRYAIGLSNLNDIDNQEKWRNQGFQLGLGFSL